MTLFEHPEFKKLRLLAKAAIAASPDNMPMWAVAVNNVNGYSMNMHVHEEAGSEPSEFTVRSYNVHLAELKALADADPSSEWAAQFRASI